MKEILTDGGKEFVNKETSRIINNQITMPYTPQQNGSAERENRTLMEAARSKIYAKNMSLKFKAEAVRTATFVLNRTGPTKMNYGLIRNQQMIIFGFLEPIVMFMCLMKSEENWMPKVKKKFNWLL